MIREKDLRESSFTLSRLQKSFERGKLAQESTKESLLFKSAFKNKQRVYHGIH